MKVLFLTQHLSTGGMPAFLVKRIQALQQYTNVEIFVIEWKCYSLDYVVQRNQVKNLVGDNFIEYHGDYNLQKGITQFCYDNKINIVHIEEIPEGFDHHNPFPNDIQKDLYDPSHPWKIVESPHSMKSILKINHPDGYACVTEQHATTTYNPPESFSTLISFPIDPTIQSPHSRETIMENNGWKTKGEFHIVNVGLFTQGKNQSHAIEIGKYLWDKYKWTYTFHFIGNLAGNFQDYWEPLIENLPPNIRIWGEKDNVSEFLKFSDLMLFTSTWECNPIVLKEAISNELKIMAYNLDHYGDEYVNIITELTGDVAVDSENLINSIHSPNKYNLGNFENSVKNFAYQHVSFYKKLLDESTPRGRNNN